MKIHSSSSATVLYGGYGTVYRTAGIHDCLPVFCWQFFIFLCDFWQPLSIAIASSRQLIICISIKVIQPTSVFAEAPEYCETPATSFAFFKTLSPQRSRRGSCSSPSTRAYWEVIITSFSHIQKVHPVWRNNYVNSSAVACAFLSLLVVATAFEYCPTATTLGMCLPMWS